MIKYLIILVYLASNTLVFASGPFTQEIGIEKQPEIIEIENEEIVEDILEEKSEDIIEIVKDVAEELIEDKVLIEPENNELVTVLNIDPVTAYSLKDYTLKGTALSYKSKQKFKRAKIKKIDQAKIPTTHTIQENDTVEKIAFRYGFSLKEIEIANAIYPGSRKLVVGDKIVIPSRFHIVKEGQSLSSISDRYKLDPVQLATYNNIEDEDVLLIGDKLLLPFFIHVTSQGESINDIAGRYEREISELIMFNNFEEKTLKLNENQLLKIPIYANRNIDYSTLDKKSINDFVIDTKNLAIIEIAGSQFMVREGGNIGNKDGVIVSIETNKMIVLEDNIEFEFFINTPIVGQAIASLPQQINNETNTQVNEILEQSNNEENQSNNNDEEVVTNVESLFE